MLRQPASLSRLTLQAPARRTLLLALGAIALGVAQRSQAQSVPGAVQHTSAEPDLDHRLYAASLAAAEAALRQHETDRLVRWLEEAPEPLRGWEWRYLKAQADRSSARLPLDIGTLTDLGVSPDGKTLAIAGGDGTIVLVEAATGQPSHTLRGHTSAVWSPTFSSDGRRLASASSDGTLRLWDVATGRELLSLSGNGQGVAGAAWSPDNRRLVVGSWDRTAERGVWGTLNVWDAGTGESLQRLEHGGYPIASVVFSRDGSTLFGATWDGNILVWDTSRWGEPRVVPPPDDPGYKRINDIDLSPDGTRLAVAYADGKVRIWNPATWRVVTELFVPAEGFTKGMNDVAYFPGGERLATVGEDFTLRIWDAATAGQLGVYHGHDRNVLTVAIGHGGETLFTGGTDRVLRTWRMADIAEDRWTWSLPHTAYGVAFNPSLDRAVVTTWQGWIRIIDALTGREIRAWQGHRQSGLVVDWSRDGRWIVSSGNDGRVVLWNAATGAQVVELQDVSRQILAVAFSPDGSLVAAPADAGVVRLWQVPSGEPAGELRGEGTRTPAAIAWSPDGRTLAEGSTDGVIRLWDVASRTLTGRHELGAGGGLSLTIHPDGTRLVAAAGRTVRVWSLADGRDIAVFPPPVTTVQSLTYSPDGTRLVLGLANNTFEIWDAESGRDLLRLPQKGAAWFATWAGADDLVLIPLDQTIRVLRPAPRSPVQFLRPGS